MSDTIIRVEGLGKKYSIHHEKRERYVALRDVVANTASRLKQRLISPSQLSSQSQEDFWALQDVSFEVKQGDRIGIIGRNGAGKSTLLKILSRITEPTTGFIEMQGRVASLLEVGTGFHPELTGKENIFLNGAILGMGRNEIRQKFDEIVAFSEVENFLDTPVKRYSSGMYVRLAFAVAAHLEPEILIVDEVLAVGDAAFQKKCLGKMKNVSGEGRTVIFVSHNMAALNSLCPTSLLLSQGSIVQMGQTPTVTEKYISFSSLNKGGKCKDSWYEINQKKINKTESINFQFKTIELSNPASHNGNSRTGDPLLIRASYSSSKNHISPAFVIKIKDIYGQELIRLSTTPISGYSIKSVYKNGYIELLIEELPLVSGRYIIDISFVRERIEWIVRLENIIEFSVAPKDFYGSGFIIDRSRGLLVTRHKWGHESAHE